MPSPIVPAFVPEDLRQLLRFVPTHGWDALEWRPLVSSLRSLSWRFSSGSGVRSLAALTAAQVSRVEIGRPPPASLALESLRHAAQRRSAGDRVLHLYFRQWLVDEGLFLDLRATRFRYRKPDLYYQPNGLWIRLRSGFREGMVRLYRSFYDGDEPALRAALVDMGMLRAGLGASDEAELIGLLRLHFGLEQGAQRFSIDRFKQSFDRLFEFFIAHDYRLHSDFVFVGFCLITLYLTLERLGQAHDVRRICMQALADDRQRPG